MPHLYPSATLGALHWLPLFFLLRRISLGLHTAEQTDCKPLTRPGVRARRARDFPGQVECSGSAPVAGGRLALLHPVRFAFTAAGHQFMNRLPRSLAFVQDEVHLLSDGHLDAASPRQPDRRRGRKDSFGDHAVHSG